MTMTLRHYDCQLRRGQYNAQVDAFSRFLDFEDQAQMSTIDGLLVKLMVDAIKRAGGKLENLHEYDLQLKLHGERTVEMTFVANVSEIPEDLRR